MPIEKKHYKLDKHPKDIAMRKLHEILNAR